MSSAAATEPESENRLKLRRTKSVTRAEEIQEEEKRVRRSQPDKPCHRPRDSLFTWTSGFDNFTGLVNWGFLLLFMGGFRLFLENFIKYGIRVDPVQWFIFLTGREEGTGDHPTLILLLYSTVPIALCLLIEMGLSTEIIGHVPGMVAHIVNIVVLVMLPIVVIRVQPGSFSLIGATIVCMIYSILFLKLWSYIHVNLWCRSQRAQANSRAYLRRQSLSLGNHLKNSGDYIGNGSANSKDHSAKPVTHVVEYPDNLYLKDIFYFMLAPTLCYELNFPRTTRIRKRFLIKRIFEVIIGFHLMMCLIQQWIIPSVKNSLIPFSNMDVAKATERLLKLAIPNHLVWLIFFYLMFHSLLNLIGELLHFADRNFYCDWWNANNIDIFWRSWNMPVHRWAVRHLYIPLIEMGRGRNTASIVVFFISAFFHEYLVSVPLNAFKTWIFLGMMAQVPLSFLSKWTEKHFGPRWGNIIVWTSLILGQPLCIMMYYHDYIITHYGKDLIDQYGRVR